MTLSPMADAFAQAVLAGIVLGVMVPFVWGLLRPFGVRRLAEKWSPLSKGRR